MKGFQRFCLMIVTGMLVLGFSPQESMGKEDRIFFPEYKTGLALYKTGEFSQAANIWTKAGDMILRESSVPMSLKRAALANILATIAFEKDNDARAYVSWSTAIRYFLEGQTSWDEEKK